MKNIRKYGLWVGLAAVCAAALIFVAVQYRSERDQARAVVEEGYQQRLYEAQEHLQAIGLKLTKAGVASEQSTLAELFSGVSRQAESVLAGLSALPLSHQAMSDTLKFCNQLAEYASQLCLQMAQGEALTVDQLTLLENLRGQCVQLTSQIALAQDAMVQESLRMAVNGSVFYEEPSAEDRPLEGVAEPDNGMEYPTMIYDGAFSDARRFGEPKALGTEVIDGAKAIELAKSYVGEQRVKSAVSGAETAGALASYGVVLTLNDGTVLNCEVTKKGGRLLWMVPEHASFPQSLTAEECIRRGQAFLSAHGYGEMEQNHYQIYDGLAVINFVALQDDVLLYPDLVKVQVRMDTGEIVGMEANNYLMNHTVRTALSPSLTEAQARQRAGERLEVKNVRLCVIPYRDEERLCYELTGQRDGQEFRVYLDGNTGEELEILLMVQTGGGMLSA